MAKILLQYDAEVSQLKAKLKSVEDSNKAIGDSAKSAGKTSTDSFNLAGDAAEKAAEKTKKLKSEIDKTKESSSLISNVFAGVAVSLAAAFSIEKIIEFSKVSFELARTTLHNEEGLLRALNGRKDVQQQLLSQAKQLASSSGVNDETIIQQQTFLALQGRTQDEITKTIEAGIRLSKVTGTDLATAIKTLDGTFEGTIGRIGKLDSRFKDLSETQLKSGAAIDLVNEKYKGLLDTQTDSDKAINDYHVAIENVEKAFGKLLLKFTPVIAGLASILKYFQDISTTTEDFKLQFNIGITERSKTKSIEDFKKLRDEFVKEGDSFGVATQKALNEKIKEADGLIKETQAKGDYAKTIVVGKSIEAIKELAGKDLSIFKESQDKKNEEDAKAAEKRAKLLEKQHQESERLRKAREKEEQETHNLLNKLYDESVKEFEDGERKKAQAEKERIALNKKNAEDDLKDTINTIGNQAELSKQAKISAYVSEGTFTRDGYNALAKDLQAIDADTFAKQNIERKKAGKEEVSNQKDITKTNLDGAKERVDITEKEEKEKNALRIAGVQAAAKSVDELANFLKASNEAEISAAEARKNTSLSHFDTELSALEKLNSRKAISDREYEAQKTVLLTKRANEEKKYDAEIRRLKRKQAEDDKLKAIFDTIINTAVAVISMLKTSPFLAIAAGVAGALELATIIAQPIPKFAKGTSYVNGPSGIDKVPAMLTEGERIVTVASNKKNWEIYEALENNTFTKLVNEKYLLPQLKALQREKAASEQKDFADNIASSLFANFSGVTKYDAERIRSKGMTINNADEIGVLIAEKIASKIQLSGGYRW